MSETDNSQNVIIVIINEQNDCIMHSWGQHAIGSPKIYYDNYYLINMTVSFFSVYFNSKYTKSTYCKLLSNML